MARLAHYRYGYGILPTQGFAIILFNWIAHEMGSIASAATFRKMRQKIIITWSELTQLTVAIKTQADKRIKCVNDGCLRSLNKIRTVVITAQVKDQHTARMI